DSAGPRRGALPPGPPEPAWPGRTARTSPTPTHARASPDRLLPGRRTPGLPATARRDKRTERPPRAGSGGRRKDPAGRGAVRPSAVRWGTAAPNGSPDRRQPRG